ncbi:unnamed protein product, partial [Scytosiphon promiscuus]
SVQACYTHCSDGGFQFMGLQFGYECYCGSMSDAEQDTQFGSADCDITCMGDESSTCGESVGDSSLAPTNFNPRTNCR